jgi:hypothetical protein
VVLMSAIIVLALVSALAVLAAVVFVAVVVAIHSEPHYQMVTKPQRPLAAMVRRLLGVYVGPSADTDANDDREECLTGSSTDWWDKGGWNR